MAIESDDRIVEAHGTLVSWVGVGIGIVLGVVLPVVAWPLYQAVLLPIPFSRPITIVVAMVVLALVAMKVLGARWRPKRKFPELVADRGGIELDRGLLMPSKATFIILGVVIVLGAAIGLLAKPLATWEERDHKKSVTARVAALEKCVDAQPPKEGWTKKCKADLDALYGEVDGRAADRDLRMWLEDDFRCSSATGCDHTVLRSRYRELLRAAP